jgi:hypothetical protein
MTSRGRSGVAATASNSRPALKQLDQKELREDIFAADAIENSPQTNEQLNLYRAPARRGAIRANAMR